MRGQGREGQQRYRPDYRRGGVGDHEGPELQFRHARHQRHGGAEWSHEAADKDRPGTPAMKEMQAVFNLCLKAAEEREMHDLVMIVKADPPRDPVAQDRTNDRACHGGEQPNMGGANDPTQAEQQDRPGYDKGHTDKGFRKGYGKGDGKDPIGMGVRRHRDPGAGVADKPMKEIKNHASSALVFGMGPRMGADIALLGPPRQGATDSTHFPFNRRLYLPLPVEGIRFTLRSGRYD